jgi:hypothetical protein
LLFPNDEYSPILSWAFHFLINSSKKIIPGGLETDQFPAILNHWNWNCNRILKYGPTLTMVLNHIISFLGMVDKIDVENF